MFSKVLEVPAYVKNWYEIPLIAAGIKKELVIQGKDGTSYKINGWESCKSGLSACIDMQQINRDGDILHISGDELRFSYNGRMIRFYFNSEKTKISTVRLIREIFMNDAYSWLKVKGREVVDIGANVADTPIYFASKGAKHVYGFEVYPYSYEVAKRNIRANGLEGRITFFNQGLGKTKGHVNIPSDYESDSGTAIKGFKKGKRVEIVGLADVVKRHNLKNAVLKVDCQGCEYAIILNSSNSDLRKFSQIMIEYHYGNKRLEEKLEDAGFEVSHKQVSRMYYPKTGRYVVSGLIYAKRVGV
jgi:FkbM family methyltransferase